MSLIGTGLIGLIVWTCWLVKTNGVRGALASGGTQEQRVLGKGGEPPDVIAVEAGNPSG